MTEVVLFPGQGAQFAGMGRDWAEAFPTARRTWEEADEALALPLSRICWHGAESEVQRTDVAQPGILTTSVAIVRVLEERGFERASVRMTAGLSLGEYSALWFAGSLDFADAVRLVRLRGEAMQRASEEIPSGMASLTGASEEQARALAEVGAREGICQVANLNAPGQIILSGENAALDAVEAAARDHGVRRVRRLDVAGGFHSECMRSAARRLRVALDEVELRAPLLPVVSNVSAEPVAGPEAVRDLLARQVCAPVLWERSMRYALAQGLRRFLEPGPGNVLAGILRRIDPEAEVRSAATPADLQGGDVP